MTDQIKADPFIQNILRKPEKIGFYHRTIKYKENGINEITDKPQYKEMADWCFEQKNMCFNDSTSYLYDGKKWSWFSKTAFSSFIMDQNPILQPSHMDFFIKMIKASCFEKKFNFEPTDGFINANNGIVDIKNDQLIPHSHKYLFKYCTAIDYDPEAKCPAWDKFLAEVFQNNIELYDLAQRLFGYILLGGRPFLHRAFCLIGDGRNGKSTFLDVLRAIIGSESYSTVSLAKLNREFSIINLDGVLANIVEETPTDEINSEIFKTLVGGGELQGAHKGYDEYKFRCNARFVFACNHMPNFRDKSQGLEDRLVFLPFERYFAEHERDTSIEEKLKAEYSGILNWAIRGAKWINASRCLPDYEVTKISKELYKIETDPLYCWFKEEIEVTSVAGETTINEIYEHYEKSLKKSGHFPLSKSKFAVAFRKLVRIEAAARGVPYYSNQRNSKGDQRVLSVVRFINQSRTPLTPQISMVSGNSYKDFD